MCISDTDIALLKQRVVWQFVLLEVAVDILFGPIRDGLNFNPTSCDINERRLRTTAGLLTPEAGEPGCDTKLIEFGFERRDLVPVIVGLNAIDALLPLLSVAGFLPSR
mgnify:CR=1 FL=1